MSDELALNRDSSLINLGDQITLFIDDQPFTFSIVGNPFISPNTLNPTHRNIALSDGINFQTSLVGTVRDSGDFEAAWVRVFTSPDTSNCWLVVTFKGDPTGVSYECEGQQC